MELILLIFAFLIGGIVASILTLGLFVLVTYLRERNENAQWRELVEARKEWELDNYPPSAEYVHKTGDVA